METGRVHLSLFLPGERQMSLEKKHDTDEKNREIQQPKPEKADNNLAKQKFAKNGKKLDNISSIGKKGKTDPKKENLEQKGKEREKKDAVPEKEKDLKHRQDVKNIEKAGKQQDAGKNREQEHRKNGQKLDEKSEIGKNIVKNPEKEKSKKNRNDVSKGSGALEDPKHKTRYDVTPKNKGVWVNEDGSHGERGESKFVPNDPEVKKNLAGNGVDGINYKDCYPDFSPVSKFDAYLDPEDFYASDLEQFDMCNNALADAVLPDPDTDKIEDPELASMFTEDQLTDIMNGDTPEGYTWHHDTEAGHMQLVPTDVHQACRHSGGRSLWGGGSDHR